MRLGITRSSEQLAELTERASVRGVEVVPLPVIGTSALPFEWPEECNPEHLDWLMFSSAHAVEAFFKRMNERNWPLSQRTRIATVGHKTAQALERHGKACEFSPSEAYGEALFRELAETMTVTNSAVIYARGREVNYDPAEFLTNRGVRYYPVVCYETVAQRVDEGLIRGLGPADSILFTAPSAVAAFMTQFGEPSARRLAIGRSTALEMARLEWSPVTIMRQPDVDLVLEYL